jgi:RNA ligase (TIGR02306 family)
MSTLKATVEKLVKVEPHPNADRLDIVQVLGWQCVAQKGNYKEGDYVIYIPIDSILPEALESLLFGPDAKVKLSNHRVKTIKLRGAISQGMVMPLKLAAEYGCVVPLEEGYDLTAKLGITKYEPPAPGFQSAPGRARAVNPNFHKYTGIENIKNYTKVFQPDDLVQITEKIHGTNFRAGWTPFHADTFWKRVKQFFGMAPKYEFVFGSHNVQLSNSLLDKPESNVYAWAVDKYKLKEVLTPGLVIYGEVYGPNIQKGYHYGLKDGERGFVAFDMKHGDRYMSTGEFEIVMSETNIPTAPVLFTGFYKDVDLAQITAGDSVLAPSQKVREGVVVKSALEDTCYAGRKILKSINPEYLLKDQSEFH